MSSRRQDELSALGQAIQRLREERGVSVRELADASRLSVVALESLERGALDPTFALLVEISRCLQVRPAAIFERAQQIAERESEA
jgi:transcriptional regulator with XRE-family HTH domain